MDDECIELNVLCTYYNIQPSFVDELNDFGLLEIAEKDNSRFIEISRIGDLERMIRLHYDLDINLPGIETIWHMLERMNQLQQELCDLRNKLMVYESP